MTTSNTFYHSALPLDLLEFARQLRKDQSDLGGWKFRRQFPLVPYVLDFFCFDKRLAVELDGGQHNEPGKRKYDENRGHFLSSKGNRVRRFWNHEMLSDTETVLHVIWDSLHAETKAMPQNLVESNPTPSPPAPLPGGEGRKP